MSFGSPFVVSSGADPVSPDLRVALSETGLLGRRSGPDLLDDKPDRVAVRRSSAPIDGQVIPTHMLNLARRPGHQRLLVGAGVVGQIA